MSVDFRKKRVLPCEYGGKNEMTCVTVDTGAALVGGLANAS